LIEMLAVVAILALVAGIVLPGLGVTSGRALRYEAQRLAADLELARERSAMLGVPHRISIDLDGGTWRTEWFVTEAEALGEVEPADAPLAGEPEDEDGRLDLAPPRGEEADYYPAPTSGGRDTRLEANAVFLRIDTSAGPVTRGRVAVIFERDGSTDPVSIVLRDEDGREVALDVEALDEVVRLRDAAG
jgi:type II secretory pathway pseudopilin PulG